MTEEFWQSYKKNKDAAQPNQFWRGVRQTSWFYKATALDPRWNQKRGNQGQAP
jgi:uncharacterized protein (DUF924 family)